MEFGAGASASSPPALREGRFFGTWTTMWDTHRPALLSLRIPLITSLTQLGERHSSQGLCSEDPHSPQSTLDPSQLEGHRSRERGAAPSAEQPRLWEQRSPCKAFPWIRRALGRHTGSSQGVGRGPGTWPGRVTFLSAGLGTASGWPAERLPGGQRCRGVGGHWWRLPGLSLPGSWLFITQVTQVRADDQVSHRDR